MSTKPTKKKVSVDTVEQAPWAPPAEYRGIGIRTVDKNFRAYGGFSWPKSGYVAAPDWDKSPQCGGGLHMLPNGDGDWGLMSWDLDAIAQVCEYDKREAVSVDGDKIKVPQCNVIKTGSLYTLLAEVVCNGEVIRAQVKDIQAKNASSGNSATNASSGNSATNASSGDYATNASSGNYAKNASSGHYAKNASSGDYAKNASSGHSAKNASSGDQSVCVAAGFSSKCMVGKDGAIALTWHDGKRPRITVGYAGEDGIEAGVFYAVDAKGKLVKCS